MFDKKKASLAHNAVPLEERQRKLYGLSPEAQAQKDANDMLEKHKKFTEDLIEGPDNLTPGTRPVKKNKATLVERENARRIA